MSNHKRPQLTLSIPADRKVRTSKTRGLRLSLYSLHFRSPCGASLASAPRGLAPLRRRRDGSPPVECAFMSIVGREAPWPRRGCHARCLCAAKRSRALLAGTPHQDIHDDVVELGATCGSGANQRALSLLIVFIDAMRALRWACGRRVERKAALPGGHGPRDVGLA